MNVSIPFIAFLCGLHFHCAAQAVVNGNFQSGTSGWTSCGAIEVNPETVYGGVLGTNVVAEVDILATLCQDIGGFVIGQTYTLSFIATRRNGGCPGPNPVDANVRISPGALTQFDSRSGAWNWVASSYNFIATAATQQLTFTAGPTQSTTCGYIVDDIQIQPAVVLGLELAMCSIEVGDESIRLSWRTMAPASTYQFKVERLYEGRDWLELGSSTQGPDALGNFHCIDPSPLRGKSTYRIKATDVQGEHFHSNYLQAEFLPKGSEIQVFPNPFHSEIKILGPGIANKYFKVVSPDGRILQSGQIEVSNPELFLAGLPQGLLWLVLSDAKGSQYFPLQHFAE